MARTREDVPGPDSLWVWTIRHYAAIAALDSDADQYAALVALRDTPPPGPAAWQTELVRDISAYLESETTRKTPGFLDAQINDLDAGATEHAGALMAMTSLGMAVAPGRLAELSENPVPLPLVTGLTRAHLAQGLPETAWSVMRGAFGRYRRLRAFPRAPGDPVHHFRRVGAYTARSSLGGPISPSRIRTGARSGALRPWWRDWHLWLRQTRWRTLLWRSLLSGSDSRSPWTGLGRPSRAVQCVMLRWQFALIAEADSPEGSDMLNALVCQAPEHHSALTRALAQSTNEAAADWIYMIWQHPDGDEWTRNHARVALGRLVMKRQNAGRYFHPVSDWDEARWSFDRDRAWLFAQAIDQGVTPPAQALVRTCAGD